MSLSIQEHLEKLNEVTKRRFLLNRGLVMK